MLLPPPLRPAARASTWLVPIWLVLLLLSAPPAHASRVELELHQRDGKPLAGAVLYAVPSDGHRLPSPQPAVMDQRDRRFVPQILPVQTGAEVRFPNTDSISHHVYSFSPPKRFELYLPKGGKHADSVVFDKPGIVALGCNIHDWMLAYILVVDTPWFTQTDAKGHAEIPDLPAGAYHLVVWHPRIADAATALQRETRLGDEESVSWTVALQAQLLPARDQEPGFANY
jgi:plastocyanin